MPWLLLTIAIVFEVAGTASMKLSRGFEELLPSIGVFVFYFAAVAALVLALKRLELSIAYAVWSALGTALTALISFTYFREPITAIKLGSLALVIVGVVGLILASKPVA
jgi:small multidrug resistance pump